jgi:hypothetical protein
MAGDEIVSQVLAQALPRVVSVTLDVDKWTQVTCATDPNLGFYGQTLTLDGITEYSRLDLQPDADMLAEFKKLDIVFVTENKGCSITVYSIGDMPLKSYTMQATITETDVEVASDKIIGIPVGAPAVKPDWNQNDEAKADYIKNKPDVVCYTQQSLTSEQQLQARENIGATTPNYVDEKVAGLVNSSPEILDTLNSLSEALGNDPNFATTMAEELGKKVDKVDGMGLSTNDYTTEEKNKLAQISENAEVNVQSDWSQKDVTQADYIKNKPDYDGSIANLQSQIDDIEESMSTHTVSWGVF